jgi:hypothetical protein
MQGHVEWPKLEDGRTDEPGVASRDAIALNLYQADCAGRSPR